MELDEEIRHAEEDGVLRLELTKIDSLEKQNHIRATTTISKKEKK